MGPLEQELHEAMRDAISVNPLFAQILSGTISDDEVLARLGPNKVYEKLGEALITSLTAQRAAILRLAEEVDKIRGT